ncbi:MAG: GRP family sugar transporter [Verrucomicrobiales bacterium]
MSVIIFLRVLFSVSANAVQKRLLIDNASISLTWIWTYALMLVPAVVWAASGLRNLSSEFWVNIILGGLIDAVGNLAMVAALKTMDLSVFGPLNGLRPLLALLFGWFYFGEQPSAIGHFGIALTVAGTLLLIPRNEPKARFKITAKVLQALLFRLAGLSLGVLGAVYLKRAASVGSAEATVAGWIGSGLICLLVLNGIIWPQELRAGISTFKENRNWLLLHSAFFLAMQWLTIRIFQETLLAYSFVFFQMAMLLQVLAGKLFFKEPHFAQRMAAAVVIALGSILILWKG